MKAFFAALLVLLASFQLANAQCNNNGVEINSLCACYSGFIESDCGNDAAGACALPTAPPLATQVVAEFIGADSKILANSFDFVIHSPATDSRYFSSISLNGNENCSYPGAHFSKTFESSNCKDSFSGSFTIPEVVQDCGFAQTSEPGYAVLSGKVQVSAVDKVGTFRGREITRTTSSALVVNLRLPTFINLTTSELSVFSPISVRSAVTHQEYDRETEIVTIKITTSVQWPYELSPFDTSSNTAHTISFGSPDNADCTEAEDSDCLQVTTITINVGAACNFDGNYYLNFTTGCRTGAQLSCPIPGTDLTGVSFSLDGEDNVCGEIDIEATIDGELASYDASFTTESFVVLAGERLYFKASLISDVSIESITIRTLSVVQNNAATLIVENGINVPGLDEIALDKNAGGFTEAQLGFSFLALTGSGGIFSDEEGVFPFTVEAEFDVVYKTTFGRKRDAAMTSLSFVAQAVLNAMH